MKNIKSHKNSGFKTPVAYFDTLEDTILNKLALKSKVDVSGFKTSDAYFNDFEDRLLKRIASEEKETKTIAFINRKTMVYISGIAAVLVLFFSLNKTSTVTSFETLDTATIDNYLLYNTESTELTGLFQETPLNEDTFIDYDLSEDTLDSYLEDLDENELISE
jgi:hypothetical protein